MDSGTYNRELDLASIRTLVHEVNNRRKTLDSGVSEQLIMEVYEPADVTLNNLVNKYQDILFAEACLKEYRLLDSPEEGLEEGTWQYYTAFASRGTHGEKPQKINYRLKRDL